MSIPEAREILQQAHWNALIRVRNYVTEPGTTNNAHPALANARKAEVDAAQDLMQLTELENSLRKLVAVKADVK
jgi:hypothetical protein